MNITRTVFQGFEAVELMTDRLRLVAVGAFGPRIAFFGRPRGENLLLWAPDNHRRGGWRLHGGHRVWTTRPLADETEEAYRPDNEPATVAIGADEFTMTGATDPPTRICRGFRVRLLRDDAVIVDNFARNESDLLTSAGVWALTCTAPRADTRYAIPLGDGSSWDAFRLVLFRTWGGHTGGFDDSQFRMAGDLLHIEPQGRENKRMIEAPRGLVAMSDPARGLTFLKHTAFDRNATYPLGANLAVYIGPDNFMVELESLGPAATLKPGETLYHPEMWMLRDGADPFTDAAAVLALAGT